MPFFHQYFHDRDAAAVLLCASAKRNHNVILIGCTMLQQITDNVAHIFYIDIALAILVSYGILHSCCVGRRYIVHIRSTVDQIKNVSRQPSGFPISVTLNGE